MYIYIGRFANDNYNTTGENSMGKRRVNNEKFPLLTLNEGLRALTVCMGIVYQVKKIKTKADL